MGHPKEESHKHKNLGIFWKRTPESFAHRIKLVEAETDGPPEIGSKNYAKIEKLKTRFANFKNTRARKGKPIHDSSSNKLPGEI
tara:strand:+ start:61 stop:312 length:252 start_codon:yes stop_codon:yes gene_type:complete